MERRQFIKTTLATGIFASMNFDALAKALADGTVEVETAPDLVAVMGGEPDVMLAKALEALGGIGKFVKPGQTVAIKPNIAWDKTPELAANINGGAAVGATGLFSTGSTNIDIYPMIVVGEDAWGQVALRGMDSMDVSYIPPGQKDKNDPLGQRGYIGAKTYMTALVLNNGWGALAWVGTPAL